MGFKNNAIATVLPSKKGEDVVIKYEKYAMALLTTNKKNISTGYYEQDFGGLVKFIGKAFEKIKELDLKPKDRIRLIEVETTNNYNKETKKKYVNYICWEFVPLDNRARGKNKDVEIIENDEEKDPFGLDGENLPF